MKKAIIASSIVLCTMTLYGQTGPGGVGTNDGSSFLELWYDSEDINGNGTTPNVSDPVTLWVDKSGNGVDVSSAGTVATFESPGVLFNNSGFLSGDDTGLPTGNTSRTVFVMASSPNTGNDDVLFYYGNGTNNNSFGVLKIGNSGARFFFYGNDLNDAVGFTPAGNTKIVAAKYVSGGARTLYADGTQTASNTPGALPNTTVGTDGLQIGGWSNFALHSNATIYEILFYSAALNEAQRYIIENYLAAKHGTTLAAHDIYTHDNPGNGNYDFDVAGIGRVNGGNIHNDAQGTGMLRISNPSNLGNNEFMLWGHDNGEAKATEMSDVPTGVEARFQRVWRVSETNATGTAVNVGSVTISWDLSSLGAVTAGDLRLLVDTDNNGLFNDETPITGAVSEGGGVYAFTGVTALQNNRRFTLGTTNLSQTPLPIDLLSFSAKVEFDKQVRLDWTTASEDNNDYFTIERSVDGNMWIELLKVDGAGTSSEILTYSAVDEKPYSGESYYRLKQTDYDGQFEVFEIKRVEILSLLSKSSLTAYPNPVNHLVKVSSDMNSLSTVGVYNLLGQNVTDLTRVINRSGSDLELDLSELSSGVYYIKSGDQSVKVYKE